MGMGHRLCSVCSNCQVVATVPVYPCLSTRHDHIPLHSSAVDHRRPMGIRPNLHIDVCLFPVTGSLLDKKTPRMLRICGYRYQRAHRYHQRSFWQQFLPRRDGTVPCYSSSILGEGRAHEQEEHVGNFVHGHTVSTKIKRWWIFRANSVTQCLRLRSLAIH